MDTLRLAEHNTTIRIYHWYLRGEKEYLKRHGVTHIIHTNDGGRFTNAYNYNNVSRLGTILTIEESIEITEKHIHIKGNFSFEPIALRDKKQLKFIPLLVEGQCLILSLIKYLDLQESCHTRGCKVIGIGKQILCNMCLSFQSRI